MDDVLCDRFHVVVCNSATELQDRWNLYRACAVRKIPELCCSCSTSGTMWLTPKLDLSWKNKYLQVKKIHWWSNGWSYTWGKPKSVNAAIGSSWWLLRNNIRVNLFYIWFYNLFNFIIRCLYYVIHNKLFILCNS